ncbi:MAG: hypothetical protein ACFB0C_20615 [Leptolyngbyaceae cyanobacterium]
MAIIFPRWIRERIKQGNGVPQTVDHPKGNCFTPYLCCRDVSKQEERRAELGIDHWAFERWSREGYGQYLWHCAIPGPKEATWHLSKDFPAKEHPVLIYLRQPVITLLDGCLLPGLYIGRCEFENDEHAWKAKNSRYGSVWLNLSNHKNSNQLPELFWLPLPFNE